MWVAIALLTSGKRLLLLPGKAIKVALLLITVRLLSPCRLLEPRLILRQDNLELAASKVSAVNGFLEFLSTLKLFEAHSHDAVLFLVVERDICDLPECLCLLAHVFLDLEDRGIVFVELGERESVSQDADFCPLVLLGRKSFGDFFFVIGPFCKFARKCQYRVLTLGAEEVRLPVQLSSVAL